LILIVSIQERFEDAIVIIATSLNLALGMHLRIYIFNLTYYQLIRFKLLVMRLFDNVSSAFFFLPHYMRLGGKRFKVIDTTE